jgi:hypothetical protein
MRNQTRVVDQVFLLSPAFCGGRRAAILLNPASTLPIAVRLRDEQLTLGDAFAFLSGLYFRGKLAYATAFGRASRGSPHGSLVITPTRGLLPPDTRVGPGLLREFATVDVSEHDERYRAPLERDLRVLAGQLPESGRVVLLGSIATGKYVDVLTARLGARLHYPVAFVGRGDMSRGGLLLRSVDAREELEYAVLAASARRRGPRPPKLAPRARNTP